MTLLRLATGGVAALTIPIPNNPGLVGTYLTFQSITLDAGAAVPQFTNAADCFVRS